MCDFTKKWRLTTRLFIRGDILFLKKVCRSFLCIYSRFLFSSHHGKSSFDRQRARNLLKNSI